MNALIHRIRTQGFTVNETIILGSLAAFAGILFMLAVCFFIHP